MKSMCCFLADTTNFFSVNKSWIFPTEYFSLHTFSPFFFFGHLFSPSIIFVSFHKTPIWTPKTSYTANSSTHTSQIMVFNSIGHAELL